MSEGRQHRYENMSCLLIPAIFDPALAYEVSTLPMNLISSDQPRVLPKRKVHGNEYEEKVNCNLKDKLIQPPTSQSPLPGRKFRMIKDIIFDSKTEQRSLPLEFRYDILP